MKRRPIHLLVLLALVAACAAHPRAQAGGDGAASTADAADADVARGELSELGGRRRALLLVSRSLSVDVRGTLHAVLDEVFSETPRPAPRHQYAQDQIVKKFERSARGAVVPVETMEEAEFVIVYKAIAEHRSFAPDEPFVYGEMFVFLKREPGRPQPVLLWRSKGDHVAPGEAAADFLKALRATRGER